ncbi:ABC transporter ATP-binding protein [Phaeobacter sp. 11ANDIMAR09]|uniref:ABC transporter ATP-binding protein n=1 Tax=Phaeobacter sp. 11ANDIMAR09 TaxID=1225647 RepID=UPI0006C8E0BF|nr:ABC transporter ATP-binding protein [Phaeobacter sp. 11ANDIMAR09]KPD11062.1 ABC transporter ATP-binding protein [Phaeobacter sp. 11ANDIMAR09]
MMSATLLSVSNLNKSFGAVTIADDISFDIYEGEVVGIIGPNGAGKTTLFGMLAGTVGADSGTIKFGGSNISSTPTYVRAQMGMGRTYQIPRPFTHMTVADNMRVASMFAGGLEPAECGDWVKQVLEFTGLTSQKDMLAGKLSLLGRKRHELARALATRPSLLLVDEVAAGLTDAEVDEFIALIRKVRDSGITVVWIEHVMKTMLSATDRLLAIAGGKIIASGKPQDVIETKEVRRVYLGA